MGGTVNLLREWHDSGSVDGAHRRDTNNDYFYENSFAIKILDAWWPRAVKAIFNNDPSRPWALGNDLFDRIQGMVGLDNEPNNHGEHLGSAYQGGWYGYVHKDLRALLQREGLLTGSPVQDPFSRIYCGNGKLNGATGCRQVLRDSLQAAIDATSAETYGTDLPCTIPPASSGATTRSTTGPSEESRSRGSPGSTARPSSRSYRFRTTASCKSRRAEVRRRFLDSREWMAGL